jgi:lipopolysaccharide transport system ATP-binding protein
LSASVRSSRQPISIELFDGASLRKADMTSVIEIVGVGKEYFRGVHRTHSRLLSQTISQWGQRLLGRTTDEDYPTNDVEPFWALQNVSLTIEQGEVIGIVGRNGSGKSTLLKIIAQITAPTTGEIRLTGRTGTLLEVGTGFHPELSGRENVFLNGAILGMTRVEIARKFDEIVDFSGVEAFIDTPVKRYSSGMQTRLAFSVAAHLDPEILIIDEVLAVGDAEFQKKCLAKMKQVTSDGRTVVFVSHSMTTVTSLCSQCVLLDKGVVQAIDKPPIIADLYFSSRRDRTGASLSFSSDTKRLGDDVARLCSARIHDSNLKNSADIDRAERIGVEMTFEVLKPGYRLVPNFHVFLQDQYAFVSSPQQNDPMMPGLYSSTMWIPEHFLNHGLYVVGVALTSLDPTCVHFYQQDALRFHSSDRAPEESTIPGVVRPVLDWNLVRRGN